MKREDIIRILGEISLCSPLGQAAFASVESVKKQIPQKITTEKCDIW